MGSDISVWEERMNKGIKEVFGRGKGGTGGRDTQVILSDAGSMQVNKGII